MYKKILRMRDNFIYAAIKADDDLMKALWLGRAQEAEKQLKFIMRLRIKDVEK